MPYIWQEYSGQNRFVLDYENMSPYMEVWNIEQKTHIAVNPFFRIYDFLFPAVYAEKENTLLAQYESVPAYKELLNLLIHEIAQTDRQKGIDLLFVMENIERRILIEGGYGRKCQELFEHINPVHQKVILRNLAEYDMSEQRENRFDSVLSELFENVKMYYECSSAHVHIFIAERRTEEKENAVLLASELFKNVGVITEFTWENHFGIIGYRELMRIDQIQLI